MHSPANRNSKNISSLLTSYVNESVTGTADVEVYVNAPPAVMTTLPCAGGVTTLNVGGIAPHASGTASLASRPVAASTV
jgi:hypothetical protein